MAVIESVHLHQRKGLLAFVREHHFTSYAETRRLRDMIVAEFLVAADANERAVLLEVYDALMVNLRRSTRPRAAGEVHAAQSPDRNRIGNSRPSWLWRFEHWLMRIVRP